jgi:DNA polymerase-1
MLLRVAAIDTETTITTLNPWAEGFYLSVVGVVDNEGNKKVFWFEHEEVMPTLRAIPDIQAVLDTYDVVIAHNWKFDMNVLRSYHLNFDKANLWCTMVGEYLLSGQEGSVSLKLADTAERYGVGHKLDEVRVEWERGIDTRFIDHEKIERYVLSDAELALYIYEHQAPIAEKKGMTRLIQLQSEYIKVLSDIETNGFKFDLDKAKEIIEDTDRQIAELEAEFKEMVNEPYLNMASPQQRSAVLFGGPIKIGIPKWVIRTLKTKPESLYREIVEEHEYLHPGIGFSPPQGVKKTKTGYWPTDKGTLDQLSCGRNAKLKRAKELLFDHSHLHKLKNTLLGQNDNGLVNKVERDGLIHPTLNNTVTATGRLSSSNPNSQNLPRGNTSPIKKCITPRFDGIYQIDLSQIEWRAAAWLSQDRVMIDEINAKVDQHIEAVVNPNLMGLKFISKDDPESKKNRDNAKVFNFRMIYGGSPYGFYLDPKMPDFSKKRWAQICNGFDDKYCGLKAQNDKFIQSQLTTGMVQIPTGRFFKFQKSIYKEGYWQYNERQAKNYPVQGIAGGDMLPLLAVIIRRGLVKGGYRSKLILTVHDSLVFDFVADELEKLNKLCLTVAKNLPTYFEAYFGHKWNTRIDAESEVGPDYGTLKFYGETK